MGYVEKNLSSSVKYVPQMSEIMSFVRDEIGHPKYERYEELIIQAVSEALVDISFEFVKTILKFLSQITTLIQQIINGIRL